MIKFHDYASNSSTPHIMHIIPYLDMPPEAFDNADHPDAELVDQPEAELDILLMLLTLRLLGVPLPNQRPSKSE